MFLLTKLFMYYTKLVFRSFLIFSKHEDEPQGTPIQPLKQPCKPTHQLIRLRMRNSSSFEPEFKSDESNSFFIKLPEKCADMMTQFLSIRSAFAWMRNEKEKINKKSTTNRKKKEQKEKNVSPFFPLQKSFWQRC